jgi:hypothetical protein
MDLGPSIHRGMFRVVLVVGAVAIKVPRARRAGRWS